MGSTGQRVVCQNHFIFFPSVSVLFNLELDCILHAAKMHWQMRCICDEVSLLIKKSAREIKSLFDVGAR
jgi:hypothetical protein